VEELQFIDFVKTMDTPLVAISIEVVLSATCDGFAALKLVGVN